MTGHDLVQTLRTWGIRVTAQRLAVAQVLTESDDHPTAQQVYERVRDHFPHITMGTIYNTMTVLAEKGFVQPLIFSAGTRYDSNLEPHANLVCVRCGSITDSDDEDGAVKRLRSKAIASTGFKIMGQRVDFYGLCSNCE